MKTYTTAASKTENFTPSEKKKKLHTAEDDDHEKIKEMKEMIGENNSIGVWNDMRVNSRISVPCWAILRPTAVGQMFLLWRMKIKVAARLMEKCESRPDNGVAVTWTREDAWKWRQVTHHGKTGPDNGRRNETDGLTYNGNVWGEEKAGITHCGLKCEEWRERSYWWLPGVTGHNGAGTNEGRHNGPEKKKDGRIRKDARNCKMSDRQDKKQMRWIWSIVTQLYVSFTNTGCAKVLLFIANEL